MENTLVINIPIPIPIRRYPTLKWRINFKAFLLLFFILAVSLLIIYIFQVNELIKNTYLIQDYQKKINGLSQENEDLEINFSRANSLVNITELIKNLNFEKAEQINYIQVLEGQVVSK